MGCNLAKTKQTLKHSSQKQLQEKYPTKDPEEEAKRDFEQRLVKKISQYQVSVALDQDLKLSPLKKSNHSPFYHNDTRHLSREEAIRLKQPRHGGNQKVIRQVSLLNQLDNIMILEDDGKQESSDRNNNIRPKMLTNQMSFDPIQQNQGYDDKPYILELKDI